MAGAVGGVVEKSADPPDPGAKSLTSSTTPVAGLTRYSSSPRTPSLAQKYRVPPTSVSKTGLESPGPGLRSATRTDPPAVLSRYSSRPLAFVLAVKYSPPPDAVSQSGNELNPPDATSA